MHGLVSSQFGDKDTNMEIPGLIIRVALKEFIKEGLDFDYDFLPSVAIAHFGWALLFLLVFAYATKYLNFQKR